MSKKSEKGLNELNEYFRKNKDLQHSKDMSGFQNSLSALGILRNGRQDEKSFEKQLEITGKLIEQCSDYIRKNEKAIKKEEAFPIKKMSEKNIAEAKKKLDTVKSVLSWVTDDVKMTDWDEKLKESGFKKEAIYDFKENLRGLRADAKRAERSVRDFKWNNRKTHGYIKGAKVSDGSQRRNRDGLTAEEAMKLEMPVDAVEEKTSAKVTTLKEDGTEKVKGYEDGKKVKVVSSTNGQFIRSETGYKTAEEKKQLTSLFGLMKESRNRNIAAQRDANEREAAIRERKAELKQLNAKLNPVKDEAGNIRDLPKTRMENPFSSMKNASQNTRKQMDAAQEKRSGIQIGAHREKAKTESSWIGAHGGKAKNENIRMGSHRENAEKTQGLIDNRSKKDISKGGRSM